jgi:hypothetical protein
MLPKKTKTKWELHWKPIFQMMELAPDTGAIRKNPASIDSEYLRQTLEKGKVYLKTRLRSVFSKPRAKPENWEIST